MAQIVEVNDDGDLILPRRLLGEVRPRDRYEVESEGGAIKLVLVEGPVRTKEEAEQWTNSFREWIASLEPKVPHLPDEALRRDSFYD